MMNQSEQYDGGFLLKDLNLRKIHVPGDGHCFFHSLMLGAVDYYINNPSKRNELVVSFRKRVANYLLETDDSGKSVYDKLSRGYLKEYAKNVSESKFEPDFYSLNNLKNLLNSNSYVGLEVAEVVSLFLDVNIIIWDDIKKDIYRHGDKDLLFFSENSTIVLIYNGINHYDLMGLQFNNEIYTHFTSENSLIIQLNKIW